MSIWQYSQNLFPEIAEPFRLSLNEGDTPCEQSKSLADMLKLEKLYLKREDLNPTGSFKDRCLAFQLSVYRQRGKDRFVIPSSGNAAISAAGYCRLFDCQLHIFIFCNIPADKLRRLLKVMGISDSKLKAIMQNVSEKIEKDNVTVYLSKKPVSDSVKFAKKTDAVQLRGSTDDFAIPGFKTIAYELARQAADADAIFIPCSSGTSTVGMYQGFLDIGKKPPAFHIIQTTKVHAIASEFDKAFQKTRYSLASGISDKVALRKDQVVKIITKINGMGWIVSDQEIEAAQDLLKDHCNIEASYDACLSAAGLMKSLRCSKSSCKRPVLILSGK